MVSCAIIVVPPCDGCFSNTIIRKGPRRVKPGAGLIYDHASVKYGEPVEDMSFGYWSWESGARGSIETGIIYKGDGYHHIIVSGTEGELETWYSGDTLLRVRTNGEWKVVELEPTPNPVDEMVMALEEGRPHKSSGEQGLATHEVLMAVYESSRRRGVVELPLQYRGNPLKDMIEQGVV